jgi:hypothetical protein
MIVKVQLSQFDSQGRTMMLVYNEDRSIMYEDEATKPIIDAMSGEPKKFFHAELIPDPKYPKSKTKRKILIGIPAAWQLW